MTIDQAQNAAELLEQRKKICVIQSRMKADKTLVVCLMNGVESVPEEALPYIEEALEKAKKDIETKISEL